MNKASTSDEFKILIRIEIDSRGFLVKKASSVIQIFSDLT